MSQNIERLKELLFDAEKETLANLEGRLERIARSNTHDRETFARRLREITEEEAGHRREIGKQLEAVFERAGTIERFRTNVAEVLDGALRQAEVDRHSELSEAMAPLVVRTIKTEIHNSKDELVDALYPITGRMVKAYVSNAVRDLTQQINRRIEANPVMLRIKSLTTGRSVAELALAESQTLELEELYIIRRGSGELVARWPDAPASANRDQVMSGILTAINEFAVEAFQADASSLRQIDLGNSRIYLRASPSYLLAAKCRGVGSPQAEQVIDDEFLTTISSNGHGGGVNGAGQIGAQSIESEVPALAQRLEERLEEEREKIENASLGASPTRGLLVLACLALAGWLGWTLYESYGHTRVQSLSTRILADAEDMKGYPVRAEVGPYGASVDIVGLAPSDDIKRSVLQKVRRAVPGTKVNDQLTVVTVDTYDPGPELAGLRQDMSVLRRSLLARARASIQKAVHRATMRTRQRLRGIGADLDQLAENLEVRSAKSQVTRSKVAILEILRDLDRMVTATEKEPLERADFSSLRDDLIALTGRIAAETNSIESLLVKDERPSPKIVSVSAASKSKDVAQVAEELSVQAERLATLTIAANQAFAVKPPPQVIQPAPQPPPPDPPPATTIIQKMAPPELTPRQKLRNWVDANAIFFSTAIDYRDEARANAKLDELADLLKGNDILVRVIGFTDEKGRHDQNLTLSAERAQKVAQAVVERGVSPSRVVAIGRENALVLSPVVGQESPNRRVQFEVGFKDEIR